MRPRRELCEHRYRVPNPPIQSLARPFNIGQPRYELMVLCLAAVHHSHGRSSQQREPFAALKVTPLPPHQSAQPRDTHWASPQAAP